MKNDILKIIFFPKGRMSYLKRYLKLIENFPSNLIKFDILILEDFKINNFSYKKKFKNRIIIRKSGLNYSIKGINDIFKSIFINSDILKKYKYLCLVEDDNFLFPKGLVNCKKFLNNNSSFISCNGKSFLVSKTKKYNFLNQYNLPNTLSSSNPIIRGKSYKGGIFYYSLFKTKLFLKIIKDVIKIEDNNLSEIFFNFLSIKYGKHKNLTSLYLAREYPRPKIFNIPEVSKWILNKMLHKEIIILSDILTRGITKKNKIYFLDITLYKYLIRRLNYLKKKSISVSKIIYTKKSHEINYYINLLNKKLN